MKKSYGSAMSLKKGRLSALGRVEDKAVPLPNPESTADQRLTLPCWRLELLVDATVTQKDRWGRREDSRIVITSGEGRVSVWVEAKRVLQTEGLRTGKRNMKQTCGNAWIYLCERTIRLRYQPIDC